MSKSILIVEDQDELLNILQVILKRGGYKTYTFNNGALALNKIEELLPDVVLLDLMLPDIDGYQVCKEIKKNNNKNISKIPVIFLTAKNDDFNEITGFKAGCSDYIKKPFNEEILIARINTVLQRESSKYTENTSLLKYKDLCIDAQNHTVTVYNKSINLTPFEFKLLEYLVSNKDILLSREKIFNYLHFNDDSYGDEKSITILITRIRKKLGNYGKTIESIYGEGYRFNSNTEGL